MPLAVRDPIAQESSVLKVKFHIPGFFMKYLTNIQIANCCHSMIKNDCDILSLPKTGIMQIHKLQGPGMEYPFD